MCDKESILDLINTRLDEGEQPAKIEKRTTYFKEITFKESFKMYKHYFKRRNRIALSMVPAYIAPKAA